MSLENARSNLKEFGKELGLGDLEFDENNTCILGIDNTFSLHITYEPHSDRLYLYSPILDGLPKDPTNRLKLYEALLEGSMLGGQMAGGGIGVAVAEELILMHCVIEMGIGADPSSLRCFAPVFVERVEFWRKRGHALRDGQDLPPAERGGPGRPPVPGALPGPGGMPGSIPGQPGKPGQPFTKV